MTIRGPIPEHIRRLLDAQDRQSLGRAAATMPELEAKQAIKLEREMHARFEDYLQLNGVKYGHSRMDLKSTYTPGWPDFSFVVHGRACFVECKLPGRTLDPDQVIVCGALRAAGAAVTVAYSLQECIEAYRLARGDVVVTV